MGLHDHFGAAGLRIAEEWAARGPKFVPGEIAAKWGGFTAGGASIGTVFHYARAGRCDLGALARKHRMTRSTGDDGGSHSGRSAGSIGRSRPPPSRSRSVSSPRARRKRGAPQRTARQMTPRICSRSSSPTGTATSCATSRPGAGGSAGTARAGPRTTPCSPSTSPAPSAATSLSGASQPSTATRIASAKTVAAVATLARADRRIAATVDQWDRDPWLLNTPGGVVDLRTGQSCARTGRDDYMTKITAVAPGGDCPLWLAFLDRVTAGDAELQAYLQRLVGYALTGSSASTSCPSRTAPAPTARASSSAPWRACSGDYHKTAPIETFTARPATATRPTWPCCAAPGLSPQPRPKRAGAGPRARSRR